MLTDREAVDCALAVAAYLRAHTTEGRAVFTLLPGGDATFELAAEYGELHLASSWEAEQRAAATRKSVHWCGGGARGRSLCTQPCMLTRPLSSSSPRAEVRRKQAQVSCLRAQLAMQMKEEAEASSELHSAKAEYHSSAWEHRSIVNSLKSVYNVSFQVYQRHPPRRQLPPNASPLCCFTGCGERPPGDPEPAEPRAQVTRAHHRAAAPGNARRCGMALLRLHAGSH